MGHVSRCIGLIHQLKEQENELIVACSDEQRTVFANYFDDLRFVDHAPYPFKFGGKGWFSFDLLKQFGPLKRRRKQELKEVEKLVKEYDIDVVISDHRYGFRCDEAYSVVVTHQLDLPILWFEAPIQRIHKRLLKKFDRVWVMDFADSRLAGKLSRNTSLHSVDYIGPYSRFQLYPLVREKKAHQVLIASGPNVYAQKLVDEVCSERKEAQFKIIASDEVNVAEELKVKGWKEQDKAILSASALISRSGYSTIMDLHFLQIPAELIPTPGQREQIYLADLFAAKQ
jgi:UDP:flavonoid glycosyltransferase YjiC (YdhE family)